MSSYHPVYLTACARQLSCRAARVKSRTGLEHLIESTEATRASRGVLFPRLTRIDRGNRGTPTKSKLQNVRLPVDSRQRDDSPMTSVFQSREMISQFKRSEAAGSWEPKSFIGLDHGASA
jgi:hypothetical protein